MIELNAALQKSISQTAKTQPKTGQQNIQKKAGTDFNSLLDKMTNGDKETADLLKSINGQNDIGTKAEYQAIQAEKIDAIPVDDPNAPTSSMDTFMDSVSDINDGQLRLKKMIDYLSTNPNMSAKETISLQMMVFRHAQELELASKLTQEATQIVRQTLNMNVG